MSPPSTILTLVVALKAEARPLIDRFGLRHLSNGGAASTYGTEGLTLTVTGPGKEAAAAATARLAQAHESEACTIWLNVGIAGCGHLPLGAAFMAHEIVDERSGEKHYPAFPFRPPCPTATVITVCEPVDDYHSQECGYDMEASAIFQAARSTCELVHSLKIVSDTSPQELREISAHRVEELVAGCGDQIEDVITLLRSVASRPRAICERDPLVKALLDRCHFTVTESRQLLSLLERLRAVIPTGVPSADELLTDSHGRGAHVLNLLRHELGNSRLRIRDV